MADVIFSTLSHPHEKDNVKVPLKTAMASKSTDGRVVQKTVHVPHHQVEAHAHVNKFITMPKDTISSTAFTTNTFIDFYIKGGSAKRLTSFLLRFKIRESAASSMVILPAPLLIDRLEIAPKRGSGKILAWCYGDTLYQNLCLTHSKEQFEQIRKISYLSSNYYITDEYNLQKASESRWYSVSLDPWLFSIVHPNFQHVKEDIRLRVYTRNGIVVSGSGNPVLDDMELICEEIDENHNYDHDDHEGLHLTRAINAYNFLDPVQMEVQTTLSASSKYQFDLENLVGKCAFLSLAVRSSLSATSKGIVNYVYLGSDSQIDLVSHTQKSLLCNGAPISGDLFLFDLARKYSPSDFTAWRSCYIIPFCDNPVNALMTGSISGFVEFDKTRKYLNITPGAAAVSEVQTLDVSATPTSGNYNLCFKGEITDSLAFNANAASIKAALENLEWFKRNNVTVTASAALSTGDITLTFTDPNGALDGELVKCLPIALENSTIPVTVSTARSTVGRRGFTTGTYYITVYAWVYRSVLQNGNALVSTAE